MCGAQEPVVDRAAAEQRAPEAHELGLVEASDLDLLIRRQVVRGARQQHEDGVTRSLATETLQHELAARVEVLGVVDPQHDRASGSRYGE